MKIKEINAFSQNLALSKPYSIAYQKISDVKNIFLVVTLENGIIGIGSANPNFEVVGETPSQTLENCISDFCQSFVGKDIRHFRNIIKSIETAFPNKPGTLAIWDIALHDAFGKYLDIPVVGLYGQCIERLPTSCTIGIMGVEETLREAREYESLGFNVLKIKTGLDIELDIERVIKLNERFKKLTIRVDANQGYTKEQLLQFVRATEKYNLQLIEQPIPVGDESQLVKLDEKIRKLLVADESLKNSTSAVTLAVKPQIFGVYNIKLMKCGGLIGAFEIATIAKAANIDLFWGCNDESIVSITAALHAAFACPNTKYLDLDGSLDLAEDLVHGGFILKNGELSIGGKSGFGVEIN
ncbi:dipeptide epimerase [Arenibacter sp. S6351L]|uniref:mandelate racemase/muconate lactonizing enzyme family protein n=1 Tax=Arenibacter sp. S6351L TaxID=2926407 RepID=UPI001FF5473A|nr:dipeptide epimerase [Arenibacter sp. S6351L]MCK0135346.1 dipeptide epimerase [Arenibacter sp. S6351L]